MWIKSTSQGFVSQSELVPDPKCHAACAETPALLLVAPRSLSDGVQGDLQYLNPSVTVREKFACFKQGLRENEVVTKL